MSVSGSTVAHHVIEVEEWAPKQAGLNNTSLQLDRVFEELDGLRTCINRESEMDATRGALWDGLEAIHFAIRETRCEIASLHAKAVRDRQFNRATDELDAVVADTESATETILTSAEAIDDAARALQREVGEGHAERLQAMRADAVRIFEACNFQDITGQRITKVVTLLQFIEGRVGKMLDIWTAIEAFSSTEAAAEPERGGDEALLNGPALAADDGVVSQDDIDSLFS